MKGTQNKNFLKFLRVRQAYLSLKPLHSHHSLHLNLQHCKNNYKMTKPSTGTNLQYDQKIKATEPGKPHKPYYDLLLEGFV